MPIVYLEIADVNPAHIAAGKALVHTWLNLEHKASLLDLVLMTTIRYNSGPDISNISADTRLVAAKVGVSQKLRIRRLSSAGNERTITLGGVAGLTADL